MTDGSGDDDHLPVHLMLANAHAVVVHVRFQHDGALHDEGLVVARRHCRRERPARQALLAALDRHPRRNAARVLACIDGAWRDLRQLLSHAPTPGGAAAAAA